MIRSILLTPDGKIEIGVPCETLPARLEEAGTTVWLDINEEPAEVSGRILRDVFRFHPLAVDDALEEVHVPKVDDWDDYVYLVLHSVDLPDTSSDDILSLELDIFIAKNYIITYQDQCIQEVERVWERCLRDERYIRRGPGQIAYLIADELVEGYEQAISLVEDTVDDIEDRIFNDPEANLQAQLFTLKRILLHLRRTVTPQRDALNKLARNDYRAIDSLYKVFFRDVYDHLVRLTDVNDSMRELVSEALNSYLSVVNNRLNDVMKTLTIITTLFMPISFLTGFFGMNFFEPGAPPISWTGRTFFVVVLLAMFAIPAAMYMWIKRQRWM